MLPYIEKFERVIINTLLILMASVVVLSTIELAWILVMDVLTPPVFLLEIREMLEIFGLFLLVLIGIELLHSIKIYIVHREFHLETVLTVAMIAVARKIIVLEPKELPEGAILGIATLVLALALGYYVMRRSRKEIGDSDLESKK